MSELVNILGRNTEYSALHQPHMYYYNENVHTLLDTICKLSTEKICTIQQIMQQLYGEQKGSQAELVHTCLRRLHHWVSCTSFLYWVHTLLIRPHWQTWLHRWYQWLYHMSVLYTVHLLPLESSDNNNMIKRRHTCPCISRYFIFIFCTYFSAQAELIQTYLCRWHQ